LPLLWASGCRHSAPITFEHLDAGSTTEDFHLISSRPCWAYTKNCFCSKKNRGIKARTGRFSKKSGRRTNSISTRYQLFCFNSESTNLSFSCIRVKSMSEIQAWRFLVSRNQFLDYRTVVAPDFMCQANIASLLAKAAEGDLTNDDSVYYREIHG
jgi:hypothetical protein